MTTPTATPKLPDLARRIAQQEAALAALRRKLDARLTDLNRRREKLRTELRTVESEIEVVAQGGPQGDQAIPDQTPSREADARKSTTATPARRHARSGPSLSQFLVRLVREHKGTPLSLKELQEQTVRGGFRSASANLPRMVKKRAYELVERGQLGRDRRTGGFVLAQGMSSSKATTTPTASSKALAAPKPSAAAKLGAPENSASAKSPAAPTAGARNGQPSLRSVLLDIMNKAGRTLSAQELADRAKKAGYHTRSRNFKDVIWVVMRNMPQAERDPKGGYRLKKGKQ